MTLLLNNDDVKQILSMEMTLTALEKSYKDMIEGSAVCRPRIDLQIPTGHQGHVYQWGTMEGGASGEYFAIRMKSDVLHEQEYGGTRTLEKFCIRPGTFCGLIFLFRVENGEPLAILNDGYLQHLRTAADSALGARYMARENSSVLGMFGSGGMARSHVESLRLVRDLKLLKVYSPTPANREAFAREMSLKYSIEAVTLDNPEEVYREADIICSCTDANVPVILGRHIPKGVHITSIGGRPDDETFLKVDRYLRLGDATRQYGSDQAAPDEFLRYITPSLGEGVKRSHKGARGLVRVMEPSKVVYLKDILAGEKGRLSEEDVTYSERGNLQGAQFHAVAGRVYEHALERGLGRQLPTEWFLQDIRD